MTSESQSLADAIIRDHVVYAMGAAALPIPAVDVAAVTAVQLDLVRRLAAAYDRRWDRARAEAIVLSLAGASLARIAASAVKVFPGVGWLAGGATQIALSGASTYAVGQVFCAHFAGRGELADLDVEALRERYRSLVRKGRELAEVLREKVLAGDAPPVEEVAETLEQLGRLRDAGVITPEEFERLKRPLLETW